MADERISLFELPDDQLLVEVKRLAASERRATAALIRSLLEVDARRLYLGEGCASMFTYCTQVLHLAEGAAYNRIEAARAARQFPVILELLEDASIALTTVRLLAPHLAAENHRNVLSSAVHKSKRQVEEIVAALNPKPAAPPVIRKLPVRDPAPVRPVPSSTAACCGQSPIQPAIAPASVPSAALPKPHPGGLLPRKPAAAGPLVTPLAPERYKVQFTMSSETHEKFRRVQDLLRHAVPNGDPSEIFGRAITLLLEDLERRRCAAVVSPRAPRRPAGEGSRHISADVRREVWRRDAGRCAFVGTAGRCTERGFLEFHHVQPYAAGGDATADNIELRCRAHNAHEARLFFGEGGAAVVREPRAAWPGVVPAAANSFRDEFCSAIYNGAEPGWRNWQTLGT